MTRREFAAGEFCGRSNQRAGRNSALYEELYCARGDMENRIKECQLDLFADRTSAGPCAPTSCALARVVSLRADVRVAPDRPRPYRARDPYLRHLKIGAQVRVSVRRVKVAMATACPHANEFALAYARIRAAAA